MLDSDKQQQQQPARRFLITGGGGYVGRRLARALVARGDSVTAADLHFEAAAPPGFAAAPADGDKNDSDGDDDGGAFPGSVVQMDVTDAGSVDRAVSAGFDCVFHVASFGMSGRDMLRKDKIHAVNVVGTQNVITACQKYKVQALVYTSTYNVVFGGQEIHNGDESLPYLPMDQHVDEYSRTKSTAERLALAANQLLPPSRLATCALRLAGVYGPGELRHLPRIVGYMRAGLFRLRWGLRQATVDFLHVDNLVQAHVKAADRLLAELADRRLPQLVAGRAFFVSDGAPTPNFDFFAPLAAGLGYPTPCLALPYHLVYGLAWLTELAQACVDFQPLLTRAEVRKTGVTHHFGLAGARAAFGYEPTVRNHMAPCVRWFRRRGWSASDRRLTELRPMPPVLRLLLSLACCVCLALLALSLLPLAQ